MDKTPTKPHQSKKTITSKRTLRTSSKCDNVELRSDVTGEQRRESLKRLSLTDMSAFNGTAAPTTLTTPATGCEDVFEGVEEDNEFLRLHRQHSPKLKQEVFRQRQESENTAVVLQGNGHEALPPSPRQRTVNVNNTSRNNSNTDNTNNTNTAQCNDTDTTHANTTTTTTTAPPSTATTTTTGEERNSPLKFDNLFKKTRTALAQVKMGGRNTAAGGGPQGVGAGDSSGGSEGPRPIFNFGPMKNTLQKMNDRFLTNTAGGNALRTNLTNIRTKLQTFTEPKSRVKILSEEEKEKRMNCKTKIIEL